MAVAKVIEVLGEGASFEEAVQSLLAGVEESVRNVRSIYVESIQAVVEDGAISRYRVDGKVTFVVD
jgi:flavin-binding protein dodecin